MFATSLARIRRTAFPDWRIWPWLLLAVLTAAAVYQHREVVGGYGDRVWYISADSWKNVYTFVYHALYDEMAWHTLAMHWPFGEHVAMADAQPVLSNLCRPLVRLGLLDERSLTYLVLLLPLVSIPVLGWSIYALERTYGLTRLWAAGWALPLTLLYPQLLRIQGHYALAYGWVFPLLILLWFRLRRGGYRAIDNLWIAAVLAPTALIHPYYLGIGAAAVLALVTLDAVSHREQPWHRYVTALILSVGIPAAIFVGINRLVNQPDDRVVEPYGLEVYSSNALALVTDLRQPHWRAFDEHVESLDLPTEEGFAYLGLVPALGLLIFASRALFRGVARRRPAWPSFLPKDRRREFTVVTLAGLVLAIYSWGFPMGMEGPGYDKLRELAGPLKQLRGLGRFAWGTFYLWAPLGVALLTLSTPAKPRWRSVALASGLVFSCWEGYNLWAGRRFEGMEHTLLPVRQAMADSLRDVNASAIIPIPFYHIGSENFSLDEGYYSLYLSTYPSLVTGVPGAGLHLSRTSFSESLQTAELAGPWTEVPSVLLTPRGDATYLLAVSRIFFDDQPQAALTYQSLLGLATLEFETEWLQLYSIREANLPEAARRRRAEIAREAAARPHGSVFGQLSFDSLANAHGLGGSGGLVLRDEPDIPVGEFRLPADAAGDTLLLSYLFKVEDGGQVEAVVTGRYLDDADAELGLFEVGTSRAWRQVVDDWVVVEVPTVLPAGATRLRLSLRPGARAISAGGVLDEVVLRRVGEGFVLPKGDYTLTNGWLTTSRD